VCSSDLARVRSFWTGLVEGATFAGQALPGVVIALALVFMSRALTPWAYQSVGVLILCYVILFVPKAVGSARTAIEQVPLALEDSARTLGRGRWRTWWEITLPSAWPGMAVGGLLAMSATMKEVPATLMLRPIGVDTLATELWSKTSIGAHGAAAPSALLLMVVGLVPAWFLAQAGRR
jgi:iron(III) transport system permease protein